MVQSLQRTVGAQRQKSNITTNGINGHYTGDHRGNGAVELDLDAVIIGAGFAGVYLLHRLRQEGFNVKLVEAGSGLGGIWHWNNYPGARVDSQYPVYALNIPEVYDSWQWTEQYPGSAELQKYFQHVDDICNISKDTLYHTRVAKAAWNEDDHKWHIECDNGTKITAGIMNCCLGFAAKRYFPDWEGLDKFGGYICHSSFWPVEGIDVKGKRVGVVGNGATGIQVAQTTAREAGELKVFIRTPNTCIPMNQGKVDPELSKKQAQEVGHQLGHKRFENSAGFLYEGRNKSYWDDPPEVRHKVINDALDAGGFRIMFQYNDLLLDEKVNREHYDQLIKRTRARITYPVKRDILAPMEPYHPFGGKGPSLEQDYYEQMDKDHVTLVNLKETPISHVVPEGIVTSDGKVHEIDILALATGFDSLTGCFMEIDIQGIGGEKLVDHWGTERGALSYMGMTVSGFPNMFYTYGPHSPTAYANGPSIVEKQDEWIIDTMKKMREGGQTKINAQKEAEEEWKTMINKTHAETLRDKVDSWYMGTNIPGKPRQPLNYSAGLPLYVKTIREIFDQDFKGFDLDKWSNDSKHGITNIKEAEVSIEEHGPGIR